jgi:transcriptional regulator with XRE-family HTH domain
MKPGQASQATETTDPGTIPGARAGPTALRIALGAQLRRLREDSHVTVAEAAEVIRATNSKISRLERGRSGAKQRDVADLLSLYGVVDEARREELLTLARQASMPDWWREYSDVVPNWFTLYVGLERAASGIRAYEVQVVHGLLQTEDYARAVIRVPRSGASEEEIERRVSLRMKRQELLTQPNPTDVWAVLDEAVLRRSPATRAVLRRQLEHLLQVAELPNVTLQVVPFSAPQTAACCSFTILRFPRPDVPDLVYLEQLGSALYLDDPADVTGYMAAMDQLCIQGETGRQSKDTIRGLLRQT